MDQFAILYEQQFVLPSILSAEILIRPFRWVGRLRCTRCGA